MRPLLPLPGSRIAIVGGCGGIGRAFAAAAREAELRPVVLDLPASLERHPPEDPSRPIDVTDPDSVRRAFAGFGRLDALVNAAGYAPPRDTVADTGEQVWCDVIDANLSGAYRVAHAALPLLRAEATPERPSAIVHIASGLASRLMPGYGAYGASKAGMIALTKALAVENAPLVRANAVAPGAVRTEFQSGGLSRPTLNAPFDEAAYARTVPMGRLAESDDVTGAILFLCSPAAAFITGQTLWINGGGLTP
ncbi:MAG: SDR family oxidoreductase [Acetobacteraceae bacterium]|nr:SDR family oxidoreductase [Acetobacteraceae bacterium]